MTKLTLTKTRMRNGVWEGRVSGAGTTGMVPEVGVKHLDQPVAGVKLEEASDPGTWDLSVPVPSHAIADGVQTFVIFDQADQTKIGSFTLVAGEAVAEGLLAEVELLRAELDMLKRAFRRHCLETMHKQPPD